MFRLTFPHAIMEDGREEAQYDVGTGKLKIKLPKQEMGQHFENLNLLTNLMYPEKRPADEKWQQNLIQEMDDGSLSTAEREALFDWGNAIIADEKEEVCLESDGINSVVAKYGFNNAYTGYFNGYNEMLSLHDMIQLADPERDLAQLSITDRRLLQEQLEDEKFDEDYYIHDVIEDGVIQEMIAWKAWWQQPLGHSKADIDLVDQLKSLGIQENNVVFTEEEKQMMVNLPKRSYLMDDVPTIRQHYLSLISLLFAFAYNHRLGLGDATVESAWTIGILSPTLSWFAHPQSLPTLISTLYRRTLCCPLYRHFDLATRCLQDVNEILSLGREAVVKALLEVNSILQHHEDGWRLSKIWLDDYASWAQQLKGMQMKILNALNRDLESILEDIQMGKDKGTHGAPIPTKTTFSMNGWRLVDLDQLAIDIQEEQLKEHCISDSVDSDENDSSSDSSEASTTDSDTDDEEEMDSTDEEQLIEPTSPIAKQTEILLSELGSNSSPSAATTVTASSGSSSALLELENVLPDTPHHGDTRRPLIELLE